jgi:hypothetical protein
MKGFVNTKMPSTALALSAAVVLAACASGGSRA